MSSPPLQTTATTTDRGTTTIQPPQHHNNTTTTLRLLHVFHAGLCVSVCVFSGPCPKCSSRYALVIHPQVPTRAECLDSLGERSYFCKNFTAARAKKLWQVAHWGHYNPTTMYCRPSTACCLLILLYYLPCTAASVAPAVQWCLSDTSAWLCCLLCYVQPPKVCS